MKRHTWNKNSCSVCGITRQTETVKERRAMTFDGRDHYQYKTKMKYYPKNGTGTFERPECL